MRKALICSLLLVLSLNSFAQTRKLMPIEFSDRLSSITDTLYQLGTEWGTKFQEVNEARNYTLLAPIRIRLEKYIDKEIASLKKMPDVKNSKDLRLGMISLLTIEKQMSETGFRPIEKFNTSSSESEIKAAFDRIIEQTKTEETELQRVVGLQKSYAAANGFKIEGQEEESK